MAKRREIMAKNVLILSGSPRKGGNSDTLCDEFMKGALEAGNHVEKIHVAAQNIGFCKGCYCCKNTGKCIIKDDMAQVLDKILAADVIVLASPVYFYSISAQLKALIDRTVARWLDIKNKEFYYIVTAAESSKSAAHCTLECFRGLAACLSGSKEMGIVLGTGVYEVGEINTRPAMKEAYELGKSVK